MAQEKIVHVPTVIRREVTVPMTREGVGRVPNII